DKIRMRVGLDDRNNSGIVSASPREVRFRIASWIDDSQLILTENCIRGVCQSFVIKLVYMHTGVFSENKDKQNVFGGFNSYFGRMMKNFNHMVVIVLSAAMASEVLGQ